MGHMGIVNFEDIIPHYCFSMFAMNNTLTLICAHPSQTDRSRQSMQLCWFPGRLVTRARLVSWSYQKALILLASSNETTSV
ncbi:hypothetical protein PAXRUDRAFT_828894 [Paxillus rubicundulus Ve08.2h10]|uniref:Uncharacterized protein n=1 Tax=Paxillus rubicundulus Ve08.2h10 TaxID=930991 RepID=A0A0D0DNQ4_9AGAM|nr:hypothetical protein PAXRUDRAFT_828894 [Paxillus rubicundulus Ve08.2h10]